MARARPATPFREEMPRLAIENFYYAQEDEVFAAAKRDGFGWSVHRPHTIIGYALGNAMNMGVTLAIYATICRETGRPFVFPGSAAQWNGLTDMTDARLLARHLEWAATSEVGAESGLQRRQRRHLSLELDVAEARRRVRVSNPRHTRATASRSSGNWRMPGRSGPRSRASTTLAETDLDGVTSAWHTDADLGRPIEVVTDMSKSRKLGFLDYQATDESFFDLFARLREAKIIP